MLKFGAHQSISGGLTQSLIRVNKIGGSCLQIFSSSPRGWNFAKEDKKADEEFLKLKSQLKIDPIYFHASYLVNLADEGRIGHLSKMSLIAEMKLAEKLHIKGSIVHLGSFKNENTTSKYQKMINNIKEILSSTPKTTLFIMENAGNRKIGQSLEEISQIIKDINDDRVRLCLDTCHLFSSGYKFESHKELNEFIDKLNSLQLIDKLECWHVNDSRDPFDSGRDRHENIGQGTIPMEEFRLLIKDKRTNHYPFIIETPGFANQGPDKKNLDILKSLI